MHYRHGFAVSATSGKQLAQESRLWEGSCEGAPQEEAAEKEVLGKEVLAKWHPMMVEDVEVTPMERGALVQRRKRQPIWLDVSDDISSDSSDIDVPTAWRPTRVQVLTDRRKDTAVVEKSVAEGLADGVQVTSGRAESVQEDFKAVTEGLASVCEVKDSTAWREPNEATARELETASGARTAAPMALRP